jgi:hypothetical protein
MTRRRLEIQGFDGIEERTPAETAPWLRLAFALCTVLATAASLLASLGRRMARPDTVVNSGAGIE